MNDAALLAKITALENRIRFLEGNRGWTQPGKGGGNTCTVLAVKSGADAGQDLGAPNGFTIYGVKKVGTAITSATSAWSATGTGLISQEGIGRAYLYAGGTVSSVLVLLDSTSPYDVDALASLPLIAQGLVTLPVSGGGQITLYRIAFGGST